jgi:CheY-like chemotaxis protein
LASQSKGKPVVFVVEDNPANMKYLEFILNRLQVSTVTAYSGEEAQKLVESGKYDCMLLDINLGEGISGLELMEKLREMDQFKNTPIVAVTAYFSDNYQTELINKGFTDYLGKPFVMDQLKAMLEKYVKLP